jgi:hypothetical protein
MSATNEVGKLHLDFFSTLKNDVCLISGLRHEADQICALLGYHAANSVNSMLDISGKPIGPIFKSQEIQDLLTIS